MKRIFMSLFPLAILLTALVAPVAAGQVTWDLTNVTFADGGGVTGWLTYDTANPDVITSYDMIATYGSGIQPPIDPSISPVQNPYEWLPASSGGSYSHAFTPGGMENLFFMSTFYGPPGNTTIYWMLFQFNDTSYPVEELALASNSPIPLWTSSYYAVSQESYDPATGEIFTYNLSKEYVTTGDLTTAIPEPTTLLLFGPGLAGLWVWGRKKFKCI